MAQSIWKSLFGSIGIVAALEQFQARIKWIHFLHSFLYFGQELIWITGGPVSFRAMETRKKEASFDFRSVFILNQSKTNTFIHI